MHRKHGIDRSTEGSRVWGEYPGGVWGAPPPEKFQRTYSNTLLYYIGLEGQSVHKEAHRMMSDLVQMMFT